MTQRFRAPWGWELRVSSAIFMFVLGIPLAIQLWIGHWVISTLLSTLLAVSLLLCVRGYELAPGELRIQRLLWSTRWPLAGLRSATLRPNVMQRSWRLWGNGGVFAVSGHFSNSELGRYRAFVTDFKRTVVLDTAQGTVVVSPDRPEDFIAAVTQSGRH